MTLKKLEEEAALLARTLHAEHDASIAVAEEQERDLLRQIQEAKDQDTPELDTDCVSCAAITASYEPGRYCFDVQRYYRPWSHNTK